MFVLGSKVKNNLHGLFMTSFLNIFAIFCCSKSPGAILAERKRPGARPTIIVIYKSIIKLFSRFLMKNNNKNCCDFMWHSIFKFTVALYKFFAVSRREWTGELVSSATTRWISRLYWYYQEIRKRSIPNVWFTNSEFEIKFNFQLRMATWLFTWRM